MKNPTIYNVNKIAQILILTTAIQNKGVGHVFMHLHGHVNMIDVAVYDGERESDKTRFKICDCSTNDTKALTEAIATLTQIMENGLSVLPQYLEAKEKEKAKEMKELQRLLDKNGITANLKNVA